MKQLQLRDDEYILLLDVLRDQIFDTKHKPSYTSYKENDYEFMVRNALIMRLEELYKDVSSVGVEKK